MSSEEAETTASTPYECETCFYVWDILFWAANNEAMSEDVKIFARNLLDDWSK